MSRLAAPRRRNGFVILRAVRSPPAASHPVSRRRSCLRLHVSRLHIGWTFTPLTRQHHGRTHPRESGDPKSWGVSVGLRGGLRGHMHISSFRSPRPEPAAPAPRPAAIVIDCLEAIMRDGRSGTTNRSMRAMEVPEQAIAARLVARDGKNASVTVMPHRNAKCPVMPSVTVMHRNARNAVMPRNAP